MNGSVIFPMISCPQIFLFYLVLNLVWEMESIPFTRVITHMLTA